MPMNAPPPKTWADANSVADWLEIQTLLRPDKNMSSGDLTRVLNREGVFDSENGDQDEKSEQFCLEVFSELAYRERSLDGFYPFVVKGSLLTGQEDFDSKYVAYVFCLCLSFLGWDHVAGDQRKPRHLFEKVSALAGAAFLGADYFIFGTSSEAEPTTTADTAQLNKFASMVNRLCEFLGEGGQFRTQKTLNKQDDHLDIVLLKRLDNDRSNNMIYFGQCASGNNWDGKISEMRPKPFMDHWVTPSMQSPLAISFFVPHRIEDGWDYFARYAEGLFFDRLRIARWLPRHPDFPSISQSLVDNIDAMMSKKCVA